MQVRHVAVRQVLTRSSGYLRAVCSHSLQPYRGCSYGRALCGVGCYVRHNAFVTRGRPWGGFLEVRDGAPEAYLAHCARERRWARRARSALGLSIFLSSATDPFVPQERRYRVTQGVLEAMCLHPPDALILQTHSHRAPDYADLYRELARHCALRVHVSVESDRDRLPGLPPPASTVERRLAAASALRGAGIRTVVTVSPLLPIADPRAFFARIEQCADAVVIDHFIGGDGSRDGSRTQRTALPAAMAALEPESVGIGYRDRMVEIARQVMPGRVGVHVDGFAGRMLPP